jgi:hypothetical protein
MVHLSLSLSVSLSLSQITLDPSNNPLFTLILIPNRELEIYDANLESVGFSAITLDPSNNRLGLG